MKRAAIYARVSTKEQKDSGTSLDSQLQAMRMWASQNGYDVVCEFSEDWTGTQLDRLKLNEAKRLAQTKEIDALLVYSWDRLARDTTHQHVLRYLFKEQWGIDLICVTQPEMDEFGKMIYESTIAVAAEIENYMRRERTTRGIREAAITRGQLPSGGHGLYGYDYVPKSKGGDGKRTINEAEVRIVRLIFTWLVEEKLSIHKIAKRLEEMGIRTKKGNQKWRYSTLDRLLRNPVYCGKTYAYRWEAVEPLKPTKANRRNKKSSVRLRPQDQWIELRGDSTPGIVSEELWRAAQAQLRQNRRQTRTPKFPYLLRGMVQCYCGKSMVACSISERHRYYRCGAKAGVDVAHHFLMKAEPLEEKIWADVQTILTYPEIVLEQLEEEAQSGGTILQERIAETQATISSLELAERRAISLYSLGKIDKRKIDDEIDRIRTEREAWKGELAKLEERLQLKLKLAAQRQQLEEICERIDRGLDHLSFEQKREVLQAFGLHVHVTEDRSYECFGALPAICKLFPTPSPWGSQNPPPPPSPTGIL